MNSVRVLALTVFTFLLCSFSCRAQEVPSARAEKPRAVHGGGTRPALLAGSWYPASGVELRRVIAPGLEKRLAPGAAPVLALIGPHAGLPFSGRIAASAYAELAVPEVRRVFLLGPSHSVPFRGIALPDETLGAYATPFGPLVIDRAALESLRNAPGFGGPPAAQNREHSLEMHAVVLAAVRPDVSIVPLLVGELGDAGLMEQVAGRLRALLEPGDVVVASSDFTHYGADYGYVPFREQVPQRLEELLQGALAPLLAASRSGFEEHLKKTGDTICGREPIRLLLSLLPPGTTANVAASDKSGAMTGSYDASVSYAGIVYRRPGGWPRGAAASASAGTAATSLARPVLDREQERYALRLARTTLERYFATGKAPSPEELGVPASGPFQERLAVFVTLTKHGELRGCIGHLEAAQELWRDIRDNAIAAAVEDPRFPPVTRDELATLHVEVSLLTPPRPIEGPGAFEVGRHGIILAAQGRRAVFLPQVAPEQGWDRETTLDHLAAKAGLPTSAWRGSDARFQVFEAQVFEEPAASPP